MRDVVLLDTGPLVAFLNRTDRHHEWAKTQWERVRPPFFTCEAVLAEACCLLRAYPGGGQAVLALVDRGVIQVGLDLEDEAESVAASWDVTATCPSPWPMPALCGWRSDRVGVAS